MGLALGLAGCLAGTVLSYALFDFGQEETITVPIVVGIVVVLQLLELVLDERFSNPAR